MAEENRAYKITFRVTKEELEKIEGKIIKSKLARSDYLRHSVLDKKIVVVEGLVEYSTELRRIGNNIKQLTKAFHEGQEVKTAEKLEEIQKELREAWQLLRAVHQGAGV